MQMRKASGAAKTITATEAAGLVKSGMWIDFVGVGIMPVAFDRALGQRIHELEDIKLYHTLSMRPLATLEADPEGRRVLMINLHLGGYDRKQHDLGRCYYMPVNLGEIPDYYRRFIEPVDIAVMQVCPMDENGYFNTSIGNIWTRALVERARTVILEVNPALPYCRGEDNGVHISEVDYLIDSGDCPVPALPNPAPSEREQAIARLVASEIEDGACLQIGIGGMPNAVCELLVESGVKDLGVHTEMMVDGLIKLYKAGRITGARKQLDVGKSVYTFALGSNDLYRTLDRNPDFRSMPVDYTNLPHIVMRNDNLMSINATTQIDLHGQAASETDGFRQISGTGGQAQFVRGAYASKGGKSFICLTSTYDKRGEPKSRIVMSLTPGNTVTTTRSDMMYVVTEYGIANLKGRSTPERAKALIGLAHPMFREQLEREAYENRLIPRGFSFSRLPGA